MIQDSRIADIDDVTKTGVCRGAPQAVEKDCDTFCDKARACQDPEADSCMDICAASSSACVSCINDSNCGDGCEDACF